MVPLTREKNLMKKKIGIGQGAGCLDADRRTEKEKKRKCYKCPPPARQREKKKKTEETKKKSGKERNLQR